LTAIAKPTGKPPDVSSILAKAGAPAFYSVRDSSHVGQFKYLPAEKKLQMKFLNGSIYEYGNISQTLYNGLLKADMDAKSVGEYFHRYIAGKKNHPVRKVE
jgi:KTSC domain